MYSIPFMNVAVVIERLITKVLFPVALILVM